MRSPGTVEGMRNAAEVLRRKFFCPSGSSGFKVDLQQ